VVIRLQRQVRCGCDVVVDAPELLDRVERDDLLEQLSPVVALAAWGLGEPQGPCVHERVLDVEVLRVVEDSAGAIVCVGAC